MLKRIAQQVGTLFMTLCLLLSCGVIGASASGRFSDVSPIYALAGEIEKAAERGMVGGYSDGTFRPGLPVSRGAFVKMLANAFADKGYDLPIVTQETGGTYGVYAAFIRARAKALGTYDARVSNILAGLSEPATRYETIVIMAAVTESTRGITQYIPFDDADPEIMSLVDRVNGGAGIRTVIGGFADNTLRADNVLTRAQAVALVVRYADNRIEPQGEYEETVEVTDTNGRTAAQLRKELLGMTFNSPAFVETVARYMYAAGVDTVSITTTHGGEWDGQKVVHGDAGRILSISVFGGICESYTAAGRGIIGVTAPTRHATVSDLVAEIDSFCGIKPVNPTPNITVKTYMSDDNTAYFWLSNVPSDTKRVEFTVTNSMYTVISDGEPCELGGYVNVYDSFMYDVNTGADYLIQWNADEDTVFVGENGAVVASVFAYNNDYAEVITINTTVITSNDILRLGEVELKVPVYDGEPEDDIQPLPLPTQLNGSIEGNDLVLDFVTYENSTITVTEIVGGWDIPVGDFQVGPTGDYPGTLYVELPENHIASSATVVSAVMTSDRTGAVLAETTVYGGEPDNITVGAAA